MSPRGREAVRTIAASCAGAAVLVLLLEGGLRLFGYPRGRFQFMAVAGSTLYPPGRVINMRWNRFRYTVHTNSLGFRGPEIDFAKRPGRLRVAAVGDSVTDGFCVDDGDTYPAAAERALRGRGIDAEVLNAARGGGSIDGQTAIVRDLVLPLRPDVVVLAFVTNDIYELTGASLEELLATRRPFQRESPASLLLTHTAVGEWAGGLLLRARFREFGAAEREVPRGRQRRARDAPGNPERYAVDDAERFADNVAEFRKRYANRDGRVLREPFDPETQAAVGHYLALLERLARLCREAGPRLVVVYVPSYDQVYDPGTSLRIRDVLQEACTKDGLPLLDLTPTLRREGAGRVLFLAPVDFHPNPDGYRVIGEAVADFLATRVLADGAR